MIDREVLNRRIESCRSTQRELLQRHAQLQAALTENQAQINALLGRAAELDELIALMDAPANG